MMGVSTWTLLLIGFCLSNCALRACGQSKDEESNKLPRLSRQASRYGATQGGREKPIYKPGAGYIFRGSSPNFGAQNPNSGNNNVKSVINGPFSQGLQRPATPNVGVGAFSYGGSASGRPVHSAGIQGNLYTPSRTQPLSGVSRPLQAQQQPQQQQQQPLQQQSLVRNSGPFSGAGGVYQQF